VVEERASASVSKPRTPKGVETPRWSSSERSEW
jgi:hypothetical protein